MKAMRVKAMPGSGWRTTAATSRPAPQTARDAALWRAAGSPSRIRVWSGDHFATYTTRPTAWTSDGPNVGVDPRGGGKCLPFGGMDGRRAEPARETPVLTRRARRPLSVGGPRASAVRT